MQSKIEEGNIEQVAEALFGKKDKKKKVFKEAIKKSKERKRNPKADGSSLTSSIAMLGVTAMLGSAIMGGMMKMFGGDGDIKPRELVTAMIDGFMVYIDEWRGKVDEKQKEVEKLEQELEMKKQHYEEMSDAAEALRGEVSKWRSKYMKIVSHSRKKKK
jgi:hypothetical protein